MKKTASCLPIAGMAAMALALSISAADTVVDDFTDGNVLNALTGKWSYYDDALGSGKNDRLKARTDVGIQASLVNVNSMPKQLPSGGFDYSSLVYVFECQEADGVKYAWLPFTFGEKWQDSNGATEAYVGITTSLTEDGQPMDLTAMTGVKFKLKAVSHDINVTFMIETADVEADGQLAYYQTNIAVAKGVWNDITVPIAGLAQPLWTPETGKMAFDPTKAVRLTWQVSFSQNPGLGDLASDEIDLDDVVLTDMPIAVAKGHAVASRKNATLNGSYAGGTIRISGISPGAVHNGTVTLYNAKGNVINRSAFGNGIAEKSVSGLHLSDGMYLVQVNGSDAAGKNVRMQAPLFVAE